MVGGQFVRTLFRGPQCEEKDLSGGIGTSITPVRAGVCRGVAVEKARASQSAVAHNWADWLRHPCRMGGPQRFRAGDKISKGSQKWKKLIF